MKDIFIQRFLVVFRCFMVFAILVTAVLCLIFEVGTNELWSLTMGHISGYVFSTRLKYTHPFKNGEEPPVVVSEFDEFDGRRKSRKNPYDAVSMKTI